MGAAGLERVGLGEEGAPPLRAGSCTETGAELPGGETGPDPGVPGAVLVPFPAPLGGWYDLCWLTPPSASFLHHLRGSCPGSGGRGTEPPHGGLACQAGCSMGATFPLPSFPPEDLAQPPRPQPDSPQAAVVWLPELGAEGLRGQEMGHQAWEGSFLCHPPRPARAVRPLPHTRSGSPQAADCAPPALQNQLLGCVPIPQTRELATHPRAESHLGNMPFFH